MLMHRGGVMPRAASGKQHPTLGCGGVTEGMGTLRGVPSAGACFKVFSVVDHDIRRSSLVRGLPCRWNPCPGV
jgi:hypothetical protein